MKLNKENARKAREAFDRCPDFRAGDSKFIDDFLESCEQQLPLEQNDDVSKAAAKGFNTLHTDKSKYGRT